MSVDNINHSNKIIFDLKRHHENRVEYLQNQIKKLQDEIDLLKNQMNKNYDC
jgi:chaperonin cofactor prefoldin